LRTLQLSRAPLQSGWTFQRPMRDIAADNLDALHRGMRIGDDTRSIQSQLVAAGGHSQLSGGSDAPRAGRRPIRTTRNCPTGDCVQLDWAGRARPCRHRFYRSSGRHRIGLRSRAPPCLRLARLARRFLLNYRGHGRPNRKMQSYHCGMTLRPGLSRPSLGRTRAERADHGGRLPPSAPTSVSSGLANAGIAASPCRSPRPWACRPVPTRPSGQEDRTRLLPRLSVVSTAKPSPRRRAKDGHDGRQFRASLAANCDG